MGVDAKGFQGLKTKPPCGVCRVCGVHFGTKEKAQSTASVLSPCDSYTRSWRGSGWADLSVIGDDVALGFRIGFAASDFRSCQTHWI